MYEFYLKENNVKWIEYFFNDVEKELELTASNPYFYDIIGYSALVRQINNQFEEYVKLIQCQLNYARDNNFDSFHSICSLMYGYIRNNQFQEGLKIMEEIDGDVNVPIDRKMSARDNFLLALHNNQDHALYVYYVDKYMEDFVQHNFENTKGIIRNLFIVFFATDNYSNMDYWVKVYENFPNTSLREKEYLFDQISVFASNNHIWNIALEYRKKSLELCDEINDNELLWDYSKTILKIEKLGWLYGQIGDCRKNIEYYMEGLKIREKITGKNNEQYIAQLQYIAAEISNCFLDYNYSLQLGIDALDCVSELYGKNSEQYYDELDRLAGTYKMCHKFEEAMYSYNTCLAYYKEKYGTTSIQYLETLMGISGVYMDMGDFNKSIEILTFLQETLPNSNENYGTVVHNLAVAYSKTGNPIQALHWYLMEEQLLLQYDNKKNLLLDFYSGIGNTYTSLYEFEKAEYYFNEGLNVTKNLNDNEINQFIKQIVILYNNFSQLFVRKGDFKSADAILTQLEIFFKDKSINNQSFYALILKQRADFYSTIGSYDEAMEFYTKAYGLQKEILPYDHPDRLTTINNLAALFNELGLLEESLELNQMLLEIRRESLGVSHPDYITTMNNLVIDYLDLDSIQQAQYYMEEILANAPENPTYLNNAGSIYKRNNDFLNSEKFYTKAKSVIETTLGKEHPDYLLPLFNLFRLYFEYKKFDLSASLLNEYALIVRDQINNNFSFISEKQRELYWNKFQAGINNSYLLLFAYPIPETQTLAYNSALFSKGLLLRSTNEIRNAILSSGNQTLISQYGELRAIRQLINTLQSKTDNYDLSDIETLEVKADSLDKALTITSSDYRDMKTDLNIEWKDIRDNLSENEVAIEFVDFQIFDKKWTDTILYAALVLRSGMEAPVCVPLCEQKDLKAFFAKTKGILDNRRDADEQKTRILYTIYGNELYNLIWQPLEL